MSNMTLQRYSVNMRPSPSAAGDFELIVTADGNDNTRALQGILSGRNITKVTLRSTYDTEESEKKVFSQDFGNVKKRAWDAYLVFPSVIMQFKDSLESIDVTLDILYEEAAGDNLKEKKSESEYYRQYRKIFFDLFGKAGNDRTVDGVLVDFKNITHVRYEDIYINYVEHGDMFISMREEQAYCMARFLFRNKNVTVVESDSLINIFEATIIMSTGLSLLNRKVEYEDLLRKLFAFNKNHDIYNLIRELQLYSSKIEVQDMIRQSTDIKLKNEEIINLIGDKYMQNKEKMFDQFGGMLHNYYTAVDETIVFDDWASWYKLMKENISK